MPRRLHLCRCRGFCVPERTIYRRGLPLAVPVDLAAVVPGRAACLLCRLLPLPLACFVAPLPRRGRIDPQPPSPAGKGETQSLFRRGLRPRHPGTEPLAALAEPAKKMPSGGLPPRFSFHALTGAAGCDILVYRTEPPRRTARKQKETPYRTAIPERRKGENRA